MKRYADTPRNKSYRSSEEMILLFSEARLQYDWNIHSEFNIPLLCWLNRKIITRLLEKPAFKYRKKRDIFLPCWTYGKSIMFPTQFYNLTSVAAG